MAETAVHHAELYQRVMVAASDGDLDLADAALSDATDVAPNHASRPAAERAVHQAKIDDLLMRAADSEAEAASRQIAFLRLADLDTEQAETWRQRAESLAPAAKEEARQARAKAKIDAILAEAEEEPEGGRYVPQRTVLPVGFECGRKTRCSQMKTCAEAVAYFEQCGLEALDPDMDGQPCEHLCTWRDLGNP